MMRRGIPRSLVASLFVGLLVTACGNDEASLDPPEIRYGEDISEMGMFVVGPRYTAATLPAQSNEWLLFDDIGELFKYRDTHPDAEFQVIWVHDYHDEEWLHAEDAWYLESSELNSPMGWGIAAFRDEAEALEMQDEIGGDFMTWEQVDDREWTAPPSPARPAADATATAENEVPHEHAGRVIS